MTDGLGKQRQSGICTVCSTTANTGLQGLYQGMKCSRGRRGSNAAVRVGSGFLPPNCPELRRLHTIINNTCFLLFWTEKYEINPCH